jgi:hypothetical protein
MSFRAEYVLDLQFAGPLLSRAAGTLVLGVDAAMQRRRGVPVLGGSLVRGNLRHALEEFDGLLEGGLGDCIDRWLGVETGAAYVTRRGSAEFDFFWCLKEGSVPKQVPRRTRIQLEEDTGKVKRGHLQVIEDCFPAGGPSPVFSGRIGLQARDTKDQREFVYWLSRALDYIPAMGSFKGVGLGRLESWRLEEVGPSKAGSRKRAKKGRAQRLDGTRIGIELIPDRPFCLGRTPTPDGNRIVSDPVIGGHVLKGLIAERYRTREGAVDHDKLRRQLCFDDLIFTHALPARRERPGRPRTWPLSLAVHAGELVDMAGLLEEDPAGRDWQRAPSFQVDWKAKDKDLARKVFGEGPLEPRRFLTVRTQIQPELGISMESRLFSVECIDPHDHVWCADIELDRIPEERRAEVSERLLGILAEGLTGMGKTKARLRATPRPEPFSLSPERLPEPLRERFYIVTLATPARLLPPTPSLPGVDPRADLKVAYQAYWDRFAAGIRLCSLFVRQDLTGTWYHRRRYDPDRGEYAPEWLTRAGSVLVLEAAEEAGREVLRQALRRGLEAHPNADGSAADWRSTPFLPEHGFGEILVNDPLQVRHLFGARERP